MRTIRSAEPDDAARLAEIYAYYVEKTAISFEYAVPGESEAQLGTLIDVSTDFSSVDRFASTDQYLWICENAPTYGFVIRKSSQPWRLRYVGTDTALTMRKVGLSLDDYVQAVREENPAAVQESN